ncbi:MAG: cyclic nucleotide-binding domain-containing protein [Mariprofundales bacterium]
MTEVMDIEYADGEVILAQGAQSVAVFAITEGVVQVVRYDEEAGKEIEIARLQRGDIFGEMSLMDSAPTSATIRALGKMVAQKMTKDAFLASVGSPMARMVMESLFARLRRMNAHVVRLEHDLDALRVASKVPQGAIQLQPLRDELRAQMGEEGLVVKSFPFRIGRQSEGEDGFFSGLWKNHLEFADGHPHNLSRKHCVIDKTGDGFSLIDRHSHFGTIVNGEMIGGESAKKEICLGAGKHRIQLGEASSPFVFELFVSE